MATATLKVFSGSTETVTITTVDDDGAAVDTSAMTMQVVFEKQDKTDLATVADGSLTKSSTTVQFAMPSAASAAEGFYHWALRNTTSGQVLMDGPLIVTYAATGD